MPVLSAENVTLHTDHSDRLWLERPASDEDSLPSRVRALPSPTPDGFSLVAEQVPIRERAGIRVVLPLPARFRALAHYLGRREQAEWFGASASAAPSGRVVGEAIHALSIVPPLFRPRLRELFAASGITVEDTP